MKTLTGKHLNASIRQWVKDYHANNEDDDEPRRSRTDDEECCDEEEQILHELSEQLPGQTGLFNRPRCLSPTAQPVGR